MNKKGTLIFFSGKMGSGKSTMSMELAKEPKTILISEDHWLKMIYPDEINSFEDYIKYSARLKPLIESHVRDILNSGISVIMDFPGNTKKQRQWFKNIFETGNMPHKLIYLPAEDEVCLRRLAARRREQPGRTKFDNEEVFHQVTQFFQAPAEEEGFHMEVISQ